MNVFVCCLYSQSLKLIDTVQSKAVIQGATLETVLKKLGKGKVAFANVPSCLHDLEEADQKKLRITKVRVSNGRLCMCGRIKTL